MGTNLHSCGSCGLPIEKTCLQSVPTSPDSSPPQTMVNTQKLVLLLLLGWFCMNTLKIAKNCFYDVYVHICKCASGTNARCV